MTGNRKYFVLAGILFVVVLAVVMNWDTFSPKEQQQPAERKAETVVPVKPEVPFPGTTIVEETVVTKKIGRSSTEPEKLPEEKAPVTAVLKEKKKKEKSKTIKKVVKGYYQRLSDDVNIFFAYLDQQDYIKEYGLEEGTQRHFLTLLAELSAHPPVISGETRDIYTLTHNMAHFYRVIQKDNIFLVKDILYHEHEIVEQVADLLYEWIIEEIRRNNPDVKTSTKDLYEYAGFFLNTLSGKAYLARRLSKIRMIVLYYSLLILDTANRADLNQYGIDILPPLNLLMDDIENQRNLDYQRKYLRRLGSIKRRVIGHREKGVLTY